MFTSYNFMPNTKILFVFFVLCAFLCFKFTSTRSEKNANGYVTQGVFTKSLCFNVGGKLKARHQSCFLRADTGPCRADIVQWYYDVRQKRCYRFFWGGCQGNGNRFETRKQCMNHCFMNTTKWPIEVRIPYFCQLAFDYGNCFGYFNRWTWDKLTKTCRRRIYSGCGGNQNNFETLKECTSTCVIGPNTSLVESATQTTCIPFEQ